MCKPRNDQRLALGLAERSRGQAMVEYAIALVVLIPVLVGIVDLGRGIFDYAQLVNAANEGARYATIDPVVANIKARTRDRAGTLELNADTDITVTCYSGTTATTKDCGSVAMYDRIAVGVSTIFTPITPFVANLVGANWQLTTTATRSYL